MSVWQSLVWLEESFFCVTNRRVRKKIPADPDISKLSSAAGKNGINSWSERERLHPTYHSVNRNQNRPDETPDTRLCHIFCTHTWEHFISHLRSPFLVGGKGNLR